MPRGAETECLRGTVGAKVLLVRQRGRLFADASSRCGANDLAGTSGRFLHGFELRCDFLEKAFLQVVFVDCVEVVEVAGEVATTTGMDLRLNDVLAAHAQEEVGVLSHDKTAADLSTRQPMLTHRARDFQVGPNNHRWTFPVSRFPSDRGPIAACHRLYHRVM